MSSGGRAFAVTVPLKEVFVDDAPGCDELPKELEDSGR